MTPDQAREIARETAHQVVKTVDCWLYRGGEDKVRDAFADAFTTALLSATKAERLAEREECAKVAEQTVAWGEMGVVAKSCADRIRSRSDDTPASDGGA